MRSTYVTDRLVLRPSSYDEIHHQLTTVPDELNIRSEAPIEGRLDEALGVWSIYQRQKRSKAERFIGWVKLLPLAGEGPEIEIGYRLIQPAHGFGFASEAARLIRDHAFEKANLDFICGVTDPDNDASQQVLQRLGMTMQCHSDDEGQDPKFYTLSKEAWMGQRDRPRA